MHSDMTSQASLIPDFDLSSRNTLALRARSRFGIAIENPAQLPILFAQAARLDLPVRVLGGGSNVVLAPDFGGITALIETKGKAIIAQNEDATIIEAQAGETWHDLVRWSVEQGLGGLENLALIPGTAGAAPVQNIGAYGAELADIFDSAMVYDRSSGETQSFTRAACAFAYRHSVFKQDKDRYIVLSIRLALPRVWRPNLDFAGLAELADHPALTPQSVMERVIALRQSKLPDWRLHPNAGSFFQNPIVSAEMAVSVLAEFPAAPSFPQPDGRVKLSAGWLIETSGLKGFRLGPVGISERHALVVVNHGAGQQADIAALAHHVKSTVRTRFGVQLHEEPVFL